MEYAIVVMFFAAIWHFVYQAILLPGIHVKQRNHLFDLRDRLRTYHFERADRMHEAAYRVAEDGINNAINSVEMLGLEMQVRIRRLQQGDDAFRARVQQRSQALKAANCAEIDAIVGDANTVLSQIFMFNSGGWMVYLVPIALCFIFYQKIFATARDLFAFESHDADVLFGKMHGLCA